MKAVTLVSPSVTLHPGSGMEKNPDPGSEIRNSHSKSLVTIICDKND
jgi:hypothetical protein